MTEKIISAECISCESTYSVNYMTELSSDEYPQHCPFCGEVIEEISEEYIDDDEFDEKDEWNE